MIYSPDQLPVKNHILKLIVHPEAAELYFKMATIAEKYNLNILTQSEKFDAYCIFRFSEFQKVLDIPETIPYDYMYLVLQGHIKWLINQIFFESNVNFDNFGNFFVYIIFKLPKDKKKLQKINKKINSVQVPRIISSKFFSYLDSVEPYDLWLTSSRVG